MLEAVRKVAKIGPILKRKLQKRTKIRLILRMNTPAKKEALALVAVAVDLIVESDLLNLHHLRVATEIHLRRNIRGLYKFN